MHEQEKQRAIHLLVLLVCTILIIVLTGESILMGWETGAIAMLLLGLVASWVIYITEKIPENIRLWLYFVLAMLAFFFYGIHETSMYDLAPLMITLIILYATTEKYSIIRLCVIIYFLTMAYDFIFVIGDSVEFSSLVVSRNIFHLVLVYMAGQMTKIVLKRRVRERKITDDIISVLEETNQRTEDFLANVSHELRTPINAVTGITEVMLKNEDNEEKRKDIISIQTAGHRLFSQIGDILDYTEIDTGRLKVSEDAYMISSLVNDIIMGNRMLKSENKLELVFDVDVGIPSVLLGDEKKIKKILYHLIDNAFKFTKKGGIYVRVYALQKTYGINLCLKVSDTGAGISEEELEKIRERFYQSNGGRDRKAGGLGLGLPIVYGMVAALEGFIHIDSTLGKGTTVSVSIPQKVLDAAPGMVIEKRENLCLACYLRPEKYEVPEVRDYYNDMISHMVQGLDVLLHRISNMEELKKLVSMYELTHLFIGKDEYEENRCYFEDMGEKIKVIVVAEDDYILPQESRIKLLRKPFCSHSIVNILNAGAEEDETLKEKRMICPGVKVLVVDDEPMNLMVAQGIFKDYQMIVTTADSGNKAIELCEKEKFDLIFLDHMMPEMDGVETLKRLRKINADTGKTHIIIAFTANAVSGAREMFLREGFNEFVSKPVETLELERILRKVLPKSSISFVDKNYRKSLKEDKLQSEKQDETNTGEQLPEKPSEEDIIICLDGVGINTEAGLKYCCGDRDFYMELLTQFVKDAEQKEVQIKQFLKNEDYKNYVILVHALKSTAKMVGADSLSESAKKMEMAAKNQDAVYISEHQDKLMDEYGQVIQCISDVLELDKPDSLQLAKGTETEISEEELLKYLKELKEGLDTFEADKSESLILEMSGTVCGEISVNELLNDVRQDVDDYEFNAAAEKVEALIKKVEGGEIK